MGISPTVLLLLTQTRRHALIVSLLGIRHVVLAVNKIDLVDYDEATFRAIAAAFEEFAEPLGFRSLVAIPISARVGDNVSSPSARTPWHDGPALLSYLEACDVDEDRAQAPFRLPVQWVNRPDLDFRGYAGTIASGRLRRGDAIVVAASGRASTVVGLLAADRQVEEAVAGDAVTVTLADEIDIARGDVLALPHSRPEVADQFTAHIIWMSAEPMLPGRSYFMKIGTRTTPASITDLKHRIDVNSQEKLAAKTLGLNEIGFCNLATTLPVAFDPYAENRDTGGFILIDRRTNETAGAGMIAHGLRRATNVHRHGYAVTRESHAALKHQKPAVLWFTGLSGAGKSTIANLVESRLHARGVHTAMLDGDNVRHAYRRTNETAGAGMIAHGLRRATNVHRHGYAVTRESHAALKHQKPAVLWFTGLSGAGKSTIANLVESRLHARGVHTAMLDGDNVRHGLNKDLGFTAADRVENIRRVAEVARLMTDSGLIVLTSFISPFRAERRLAREIAMAGEFIEIFVETSLHAVIARDPKGLYKRALAGEIKNFTGIDQPYEAPENAEIVLNTAEASAEALADRVVAELEARENIARL